MGTIEDRLLVVRKELRTLQVRRRRRLKTREMRATVVNRLGDKCVRCSISDPRVLQVDHKDGLGNKERASFSGPREYLRHLWHLPVADLQDKYQLLCANHNWIKRNERGEFNHLASDYGKELKRIETLKQERTSLLKALRYQKIEPLAKKGYSLNQIADELDVARTTVIRWCREHGIKTHGNPGRRKGHGRHTYRCTS